MAHVFFLELHQVLIHVAKANFMKFGGKPNNLFEPNHIVADLLALLVAFTYPFLPVPLQYHPIRWLLLLQTRERIGCSYVPNFTI